MVPAHEPRNRSNEHSGRGGSRGANLEASIRKLEAIGKGDPVATVISEGAQRAEGLSRWLPCACGSLGGVSQTLNDCFVHLADLAPKRPELGTGRCGIFSQAGLINIAYMHYENWYIARASYGHHRRSGPVRSVVGGARPRTL